MLWINYILHIHGEICEVNFHFRYVEIEACLLSWPVFPNQGVKCKNWMSDD